MILFQMAHILPKTEGGSTEPSNPPVDPDDEEEEEIPEEP